ncbi:Tetratricopeptide-like helical domain-containing protein [Dioscorea alata]|uniref:Tetratricopeptide-like helical domain-containing protein n=1 Tax=Dioscorea alata TaxID=55571 RepID=A0ACB7V941_DIOAL|nr:Tetratricopeptide-like helical domain-containing protein [Dioscorea alata]
MVAAPLCESKHAILLLLKQCKSLKHLQCIHAQATIHGLTFSSSSAAITKLLFTFTSLLSNPSLLSPPPSIHYALSLFHSIPSPSTFAFNLLLRSLTILSSPSHSLLLFLRMRRLSIPPDSHTFPFVLTACSRLAATAVFPLGRALHSQALKFGFISDVFVVNTLITIYSSSFSLNSISDARRLFDETPHPDIVTYNSMIHGYVKAGDNDLNLALARKLFDEMPARDVISWGALLAGYSQSGRFSQALELFDRMMMESALEPDDVALVSALSACANLGALDRGERIHEYIKRKRSTLSVYLITGLVDMYAKCGCIRIAREMFDESPQRNLFTWNAMIIGLAMHGHGELSMEYFNKMIMSGVKPDGVSILGVLVGCSHAGLVSTACKVFDEMECVYGVKREVKHYGCMADLLGRAGMIKEAMEMIAEMGMEGDEYVWGGVLGGCRIYGDVEVGEFAAKRLWEMKVKDSGVYSAMANMYAGARRWGDVAKMRALMSHEKVIKNAGSSSILVDNC